MEYKAASNPAPDDPAPVSNLSAVKSEMGAFEEAAQLAAKALSLSGDSNPGRKETLLARLARAHLHANNPAAGLKAAEQLTGGAEKTNLVNDLKVLLKLNEHHPVDPSWEREKIITRLARYRAAFSDITPYFPVGNDIPRSLFDDALLETGQHHRNGCAQRRQKCIISLRRNRRWPTSTRDPESSRRISHWRDTVIK